MKLVALFLAIVGLTTTGALRVVHFRRLEPTVPPQSCATISEPPKSAPGPPRRARRRQPLTSCRARRCRRPSTRRAAVAGVLPLLAAPLGASGAVENIFSIKPDHTEASQVRRRLREGAPRRCVPRRVPAALAIPQRAGTPLLPVRAPQNGCNVLKECAKGAALPFSDEKSAAPRREPYVNNCWTSGGKKASAARYVSRQSQLARRTSRIPVV